MAARRLSQSFESHHPFHGTYRHIHVNGRLVLEDEDYEWLSPVLLIFAIPLYDTDTIVIGMAGQRPKKIPLQQHVPARTPFHLDGSVGLIVENGAEVVAASEESLKPQTTIYDYLLQDD